MCSIKFTFFISIYTKTVLHPVHVKDPTICNYIGLLSSKHIGATFTASGINCVSLANVLTHHLVRSMAIDLCEMFEEENIIKKRSRNRYVLLLTPNCEHKKLCFQKDWRSSSRLRPRRPFSTETSQLQRRYYSAYVCA